MTEQTKNIAETLAAELPKPLSLYKSGDDSMELIALPKNYVLQEQDRERLLPAPRRKVAQVTLHDTDSFIAYTKRHGSLGNCTVWCLADYSNNKVRFTSIINDHGEAENAQQWRDHTAFFTPSFSIEWKRWQGVNKQAFSQAEFAAFLEENNKDIVAVDGAPSGAQMLEMALSFEANQDMRFKSAVRLQNGGVNMTFVQDDNDQTIAKMQMFERFSLGLPVYWNGDAYQQDARLRYRVRDGKLTFWYELIRPEKVLEAATKTVIDIIKAQAGMPFFFGEPK